MSKNFGNINCPDVKKHCYKYTFKLFLGWDIKFWSSFSLVLSYKLDYEIIINLPSWVSKNYNWKLSKTKVLFHIEAVADSFKKTGKTRWSEVFITHIDLPIYIEMVYQCKTCWILVGSHLMRPKALGIIMIAFGNSSRAISWRKRKKN